MKPRVAASLLCVLASILCACSKGGGRRRARSADGVNLVLILLDTVRSDHLTPYGYRENTTPFLAGVAEKGVVFERAYAASSWTPSSMASIFTSLNVNQHGVLTGYRATKRALNQGDSVSLNRIPSTTRTLTEVLKQLGYRTFAVADNVNITKRLGFDRGFDRFVGHDRLGGEVLNAKLREWQGEVRSAGKYFLYVHYNDAHLVGRNKLGQPDYRKREPWYDDVELARESLEAYDSNLSYLDQRIRELFEMFGFEKNTLVVITADHGEEFADHGRYGHQNTLYDELLRVPLIVYQPGKLAPGRVTEPVSTLDLLPTFREAAGGKASPLDQGVSLYKTIAGPPPQEPRTFYPMRFTEVGDEALTRKSVVRGRWKYILTLPAGSEELYDLEADPKEATNVATTQPQVLADLRGRLETFEKTAKVHKREFGGQTEITPEQAEKLKALGYVQ